MVYPVSGPLIDRAPTDIFKLSDINRLSKLDVNKAKGYCTNTINSSKIKVVKT